VNKTSIEWTHRPETRGAAGAKTWNPIRARNKETGKTGTFCTRISPGCQHCYASTINKRFGNGLEFTVPNLDKVEFFVDERILQEPLKQKKPCTIFVGDMFDLFHEAIPTTMLDEVFAVAAACQNHTFQFLTKRTARMRKYFTEIQDDDKDMHRWAALASMIADSPCTAGYVEDLAWPVPHFWLGASVEDNKRAVERIPDLLQTPAAVRFLSVEPQLEDVHIDCIEWNDGEGRILLHPLAGTAEVLDSNSMDIISDDPENPCISWVICGGESGPGARPFNLAWAESLLEQCRAAGTPFFFKQMGSFATYNEAPYPFSERGARDRKGGDPSEWPHYLRVREFPSVATREALTA
jgi:protein gp37